MLHESLRSDESIARLRAAWALEPNLRIQPFLEEAAAQALLAALREQPHELLAGTPDVGGLQLQYLRYAFTPERACEHAVCEFGRWLHSEAVAWASRVTGKALASTPDGKVLATLYTQGSYLDAHNDYDGQRAVAFVIGLTPEPIPERLGGHLEFLGADDERVFVAERRAPAWNALDLFLVEAPDRPHRVSLVREPVERRAVSGWFHPAPSGPSEEGGGAG